MIAVVVAASTHVSREVPQSLLIGVLVLMVVLTAAAALIIWIGRWLKRPSASSADDLTNYRSLYEEGLLGREEYEQIRAKLGQALRKKLDLPTKDGETPAEPSGAADERMQTRPGTIPPLPAINPAIKEEPPETPAPERPKD
ncbi:MAG: hypothetical protein K2R98_25475 [Gemmataceae bacterium]|nr:hypothetical protein [Gemmataceae bacterium]